VRESLQPEAQYSRQRLFSKLFGVFSAMALALALVGIFSVVAYGVAQCTTEFGIRMALGASRMHVLWIAAHIALVSAVAGIAIGLAFDSFLGDVLAHWMQSTFAAGSLLSAAALLAVSTLLACLFPGRRAVAVPPAKALRYEYIECVPFDRSAGALRGSHFRPMHSFSVLYGTPSGSGLKNAPGPGIG
jgi:ABC-type antimicrobial peptide transport system permease subunit